MAKRQSAGILLYRRTGPETEFFLVHPGGPFWAGREAGAWSVPKGEFTEGEPPLEAAIREFREETGTSLTGTYRALKPVVQKAGKVVYAWATEGDIDAAAIRSNTYKVQWPPKSGQWRSYPEVDKAAWFTAAAAREMINPAQAAFIDELLALQAAGAGKE